MLIFTNAPAASSPTRNPSFLHALRRLADRLLPSDWSRTERRQGRLLLFSLLLLLAPALFSLGRAIGAAGTFDLTAGVLAMQVGILLLLGCGLWIGVRPRPIGNLLVLSLALFAAASVGPARSPEIPLTYGLFTLPLAGLLLAGPVTALAAAGLIGLAYLPFPPVPVDLRTEHLTGFLTLSSLFLWTGLGLGGWGYALRLQHRLRRSHTLLRRARQASSTRHAASPAADGAGEHPPGPDQAAALDALRRRHEELEHLKNTLLSNLSHEVRTPLTGILGYVAILEDLLDEPERSLTQPIRFNAEQLLETLNGMLALAHLEKEMMHFRPRPLVAAEQVEHTVRSFYRQARSKGLRFNVLIHDAEACSLLDPDGFDMILFHLLSNAVKFTEKGGILLEVRADEDRVHISVHDTGIGIEPDFLPHLFDPFRQASTGETRRFRGNGIGLTIVKKLVDRFNGELTVASIPGQGSVFTVRFPRVPAPGKTAPVRLAA
ncbi:MAG: hypothetical protein KatS3mg043_1820 [Rhodothermaceae bacterium]|nr:MAG: hypothetical protein KatS3mg043_1820 [Rhodothermaceae bacterium]